MDSNTAVCRLLQQCQAQIDENHQLEQFLKKYKTWDPADIVKLYTVILFVAAVHQKICRLAQQDISRVGADDVILIGFAAAVGSFLDRKLYKDTGF